MDHERSDIDKIGDIMLPGFRFHPTDEELVGFYLKKKIQQRPLPIELIKQVDIYKYDPWDLPKLASAGEKEWYFYCPRDRKYRNSTRPNRVTGAGFWKATGTDRPIYSSDSNKCIGLKKSLVFYRGKAAKGLKTDWMMHEFRLPYTYDSASPKKNLDRNLPAHDAWAICRIFKKTNSMAQRASSDSWVSPIPETTASDILNLGPNSTHLNSETLFSCTAEIGSAIHLCNNYDLHHAFTGSFSPPDDPSYKPVNPTVSKSCPLPTDFLFSPLETLEPVPKNTLDLSSLFFTPSPALVGWDVSKNSSRSTGFEEPQRQFSGFSIASQDMQGSIGSGEDHMGLGKYPSEGHDSNGWANMPSIGFPFSFPSDLPNAWKPNLPWDSPQCPSEMSTTYPE